METKKYTYAGRGADREVRKKGVKEIFRKGKNYNFLRAGGI
jgi:hypothetical protein